ncbi:hypothetical protein [Streptomyces sp. NPDC046925]|uniref:hypothetical protein n=1 Tax=Streptomyces sp. NPDC046925 TaxID=3155375 RepID=UPI0033C6B87B
MKRTPRRPYALAAFTANGIGAAAGLVTQSLVSDPVTSALVGAVVAGTVGDLLLQTAHARAAAVPGPHARPPAAADDREHPGAPARLAPGELPAGAARPHRPRPGYSRCTGEARRAEAPRTPRPAGGGARLPQHPRHRNLHRAAQRFAHRARSRNTGTEASGSGHGAA